MKADIVVIGAGIAGASIAAELAATHDVLLLEQESHPGYHATGRSAAIFVPTYGGPECRALTVASAPFFYDPPPGFTEHALLSPRGLLMFGRADQRAALEARMEKLREIGAAAALLDASGAQALAPVFRDGYLSGAIFEQAPAEIDVHALLSGFLRLLRIRGGHMICGAQVDHIARRGSTWVLRTPIGEIISARLVNAAGAWADTIAARADVRPLGLIPFRRSAALVEAPHWPLTRLPMCVDIEQHFYFKPDAGLLMVSPADETPALPGDAAPEEIDIAIAIDRLTTAANIDVRHIRRTWAGLRTFSPDGAPVIGWDDETEGFFWFVGQGGAGVQMAPMAARFAASVFRHDAPPEAPLDATAVSPSRFQA